MKNMVFISLMLLTAPAFGTPLSDVQQFIRDQFCMNPEVKPSHDEQVKRAILSGNVRQVLKLVTPNTPRVDLEGYIELSQKNIGVAPKSTAINQVMGGLRLVLGATMVIKAFDYFRKAYVDQRKNNPTGAITTLCYERWAATRGYDLILDIASIGSFISAYGTISLAQRTISPKADFNNQLLIKLYLKDLAREAV